VIPTLLLPVLLFAPPPKSADPDGRITVWVGDKLVHFRPDGSDMQSVPAPERPPYNTWLTTDRKTLVHIDVNIPGHEDGAGFGKLVVYSLTEKDRQFTLDGYIAKSSNLIVAGSRVYFNGGTGNEVTEAHIHSPKPFVFDLITKKVTPIALPEKHQILAVSADGKTFLTRRLDLVNNFYTLRNYLVPLGGQPAEAIRKDFLTEETSFSPDGSKVLIRGLERVDVQPARNGAVLVKEYKPREQFVLDVGTKKCSQLKSMPKNGFINGLV